MFKRWLWPHKKNKYHPYALRPAGLAIFLVVVALMPLAFNLTTAHRPQVLGYATDISPYTLYSLTNAQRQSAGVPALSLNSQLTTAAANKASDMFANDYWAHVSPSGATPWSFIAGSGYSYTVAAENLAKDFLTSEGVIDGWMNSPDHRANMLSSAYNDVGFAVENGTLLGSQTTLVVAMYASQPPAPTTVQAQSRPPTSSNPVPPTTNTSAPLPSAGTTNSTSNASTPTPVATPNQTVAKNQTHNEPVVSRKSSISIGHRPSLASMFSNLNALNWGQRATIFLASSLMLASLLAHTAVWRLKKGGRHHIWLRYHPLMQASLLMVISLVTITSGYGVTL